MTGILFSRSSIVTKSLQVIIESQNAIVDEDINTQNAIFDEKSIQLNNVKSAPWSQFSSSRNGLSVDA